jgi:hypothetical protein
MLLVFLGCTTPTEPTDYYIRFTKQVDSVATVYNTQTFKLLQIETNLPDETRIGWESDILLKVRIGVDVSAYPWMDTVSTVNCCSYTYKGYAKNMFGAFELMRGKTANVIATTMIGNTIIADTIRVVIY